ncbi:MAG: hypothetical protein ACD_37C00647G0006 [uncultured bacterium]|nr:MAG: hypothetical protein ACD_37C00647G0006 [uncultured bacterium]OGH13508.1 MAG: hypothetical protein A2687_04385 [Candidatus Levybacteria bacterium RIFCSPHIGHO2_01_FULL_38_26]
MLKIVPLKLNSIAEIENILGFSFDKIKKIVENKNNFYSKVSIVIKGKMRILDIPNSSLKIIQGKLAHYFGENVVWPYYVQGGVRNRSVKTNARQHSGKKFVLNLDIKDFFPSITTKMVKNSLMELGLNQKVSTLISELSTYENRVPQGSPSSTYVANMFFLKIDKLINNFCKKHSLIYTRFVDDLTISGKNNIFPYKGTIIQYIARNRLIVSEKKTTIRSSSEKQIVTKLVVNDKIRPDKKYILTLKKDIRETWKGNEGIRKVALKNNITMPKVKGNLWGRTNYIRQFDKKIGREVRALLVKSNFVDVSS